MAITSQDGVTDASKWGEKFAACRAVTEQQVSVV